MWLQWSIHTCLRNDNSCWKIAAGTAVSNTNSKGIFKNYASFTNCIRQINNTQLRNAKDTDIVIPIYNLIVYSDNY